MSMVIIILPRSILILYLLDYKRSIIAKESRNMTSSLLTPQILKINLYYGHTLGFAHHKKYILNIRFIKYHIGEQLEQVEQ